MIRIIHAYPDLLNLYGDYANIMLLKKRLAAAGEEVSAEGFGIHEDIDFEGADLIYFGCGTESKMLAAAADLSRFKDRLSEYVQKGGKIFFCGGSSALPLERITGLDGRVTEGLGLVSGSAAVHDKRNYSETVVKSPLCSQAVIGFFNSSMKIEAGAEPLWTVSYDSAGLVGKTEGFRRENLFATQLCGPLLFRNPSLLEAAASALAGKELAPCRENIFNELREGYAHALRVITE